MARREQTPNAGNGLSPLPSGPCCVSLPVPFYDRDGITIYHGDCRQIVPMLGRFDLLLTDPPYGIGAHKMTLGNGRKKIFRGEQSWDDAPPSWELDMVRAAAEKQIIWGGNYFGLPPARGWLFWDKGTGDNDYADGELAWTNLETVLKKFTRSWVGANAKDRDSAREHPTQKPVTLMQWCIQLAGDSETILDPFAGSGTTGRAAKDLGKKCVLIEREERYCEIAALRLAQDVLNFDSHNVQAVPAAAGDSESTPTPCPPLGTSE